jgi:hypothetical protein
VAFQIALSTLLVVGAGLFLRTLFALRSVDAGFRTDYLILFSINPPATRYDKGKDVQLHARLEEDLAAIPGVEAVTAASVAYIGNSMTNQVFLPPGERFDENKQWFRQLDLAPFDDLIWPHLFSAVLGKNSFIPVVVVAVEMW